MLKRSCPSPVPPRGSDADPLGVRPAVPLGRDHGPYPLGRETRADDPGNSTHMIIYFT